MRSNVFRLVNVMMASILAALLVAVGPARAGASGLYLIDAHSQVDHEVDFSSIVPLMDEAGIHHVILSTRGKVTPEAITGLAARHPDRITASIRTKGRHYSEGTSKYYKKLKQQLAMPGFGAMAELILWHAQKGWKAPEVVVDPDDKRVTTALAAAIDKGWPFVIHIEFAATRSRDRFMRKMEAMLDAHPDHPFVLIHMGQLETADAERLLSRHKNLHFFPSHSNPLTTASSNQPWVDLFDGGETLAPRWRALFVKYPDRFILAFDNVWSEHWGSFYVRQASLWRKALAALPTDIAHQVAHGNAERLWKLPAAK